jgi:hypothetical protein
MLGAITHQAVGLLRPAQLRSGHFIARYAKVDRSIFTISIAVLFALSVFLGGVLYPNYRLNVRVPFEQMSLGWAVGVFELKEHFGGIGLGILPAYVCAWRSPDMGGRAR